MTGSDALSVVGATKNNEDYNGFNSWIWIIVILFAFWNKNDNKDYATTEMVANEFTQRDIFNTNTAVLEGNNATQRAVLESASATQRDVLENRYTGQLGVQSIISSQKDCCCSTNQNIIENRYANSLAQAQLQKEILENRYENSLQINTLQAQLNQCCCDIEKAIKTDGEATRSLITANTIQNLRDALNERDRELQSAQYQISQISQTQNITNTLRPFPQPAYLTTSPYQSFYGIGLNGTNPIVV